MYDGRVTSCLPSSASSWCVCPRGRRGLIRGSPHTYGTRMRRHALISPSPVTLTTRMLSFYITYIFTVFISHITLLRLQHVVSLDCWRCDLCLHISWCRLRDVWSYHADVCIHTSTFQREKQRRCNKPQSWRWWRQSHHFCFRSTIHPCDVLCLMNNIRNYYIYILLEIGPANATTEMYYII